MADDAEPDDTVYAAGKWYRKRPDGTLEFIGYPEVGDEPEHD